MKISHPETKNPPFGVITSGTFLSNGWYAGWRKHGTNDWQLLCTVRGKGRFVTSRGGLDVGPGDIVLLHPRVPHDYGSLPRPRRSWAVRWVHFLPEKAWLPWLRWPEFAPGVLRLSLQTPELRSLVPARLAALEGLSRGSLRHAAALSQTVLQEIILHCDTCNPRPADPLVDPRIRRAADHLSENLGKRLRLAQLARHGGLSLSRFSHLFRQETGKSPLDYLQDLRMRHAIRMLRHTGRRISEIAYEAGYEDPLYFSTRFRRYTGLSPRAFRKQYDVFTEKETK